MTATPSRRERRHRYKAIGAVLLNRPMEQRSDVFFRGGNSMIVGGDWVRVYIRLPQRKARRGGKKVRRK